MQNFLLQKLFLGPSWCYLDSFSVRRNRRRRRFCPIFKVFWLLANPSGQHITPHLCLRNCRKSFCYPVSYWSAMMASSRRCRRCMMDRFWFWKGLYIFSRFALDPGLKPSQHIVSSTVIPPRMCSPPSHRAGAVRRTPPSRCHTLQPRF